MRNEIKPYHCRGYLFCMYKLLRLSTTKIGKKCNTTAVTILYWLRKFEIEVRPNNSTKINKPKKYEKKKTCEYCRKILTGHVKTIIFSNITQEIPFHYFCSKRCKALWIYKKQKEKLKNLLLLDAF